VDHYIPKVCRNARFGLPILELLDWPGSLSTVEKYLVQVMPVFLVDRRLTKYIQTTLIRPPGNSTMSFWHSLNVGQLCRRKWECASVQDILECHCREVVIKRSERTTCYRFWVSLTCQRRGCSFESFKTDKRMWHAFSPANVFVVDWTIRQ